jgi:transposase
MSDAEWAVTEPTLPALAWKQGKGGRPAGHCRRDIVDAIRYLVKEGICWRAMPEDFPPVGRQVRRMVGLAVVVGRSLLAGLVRAVAVVMGDVVVQDR